MRCSHGTALSTPSRYLLNQRFSLPRLGAAIGAKSDEDAGFLRAHRARAGSKDGRQPAGLREGGLVALEEGGPPEQPSAPLGGYPEDRARLQRKLEQERFRLGSEFPPELSSDLIFSLYLGFPHVKCKGTYRERFPLIVVS